MKEGISYIPTDSTLEIWLLEELIKEPPRSDCVEDFLSGTRDMVGGEVSSLILGASEEAELSASTLSDGIIVRELEIHPKSRKILQKGSEINLTPKEFDILYSPAQSRSRVFTKEQTYRAAWEDNYLLDDGNIMALVRKLHKKIESDSDAPKYILTIWDIEYKFNDQLWNRRTEITFDFSPPKFSPNRKKIAKL